MRPKTGPCMGCTERFPACSDNCPKDARGEYGYKAWKEEYQKQQVAEKEYLLRRREDWMRSEEREAGQVQFAKHKNKMRGVKFNGRK